MVNIAIPYKGRSLEQVLGRFVDIGIMDPARRDFYVSATAQDKERISQERHGIEKDLRCGFSSREDVERRLQSVRKANPAGFDLKVDYDLYRQGQPPRILFAGTDTQFNGSKVRLVGMSHYDIPTALRNHVVQIAYVGWDEIYADQIENLTDKRARDWNALNGHLRRDSTDVRILGSAGLYDYTGHFVMIDESIVKRISCIGDFTSHNPYVPAILDEEMQQIGWEKDNETPVYVDHKYQKIYASLMVDPWWAEHFQGTTDIEDRIKQEKGVGIYVVETGDTVKRKGIHLVGEPILVSETVIAVNVEDFLKNPAAIKLADTLNPIRPEKSKDEFIKWYRTLCKNLGENYRYVRETQLGNPRYVPPVPGFAYEGCVWPREETTEPYLKLAGDKILTMLELLSDRRVSGVLGIRLSDRNVSGAIMH